MNAFWKWLAVAGCGVGLLVAADRLRVVRADDDAPAYDRSGGGDSLDRLDRIVEKLGRVVARMEHGGPPPHDRPPHDGDHPRGEHGDMRHGRPPHGHRHHSGPGFGPGPGPGPMWGGMSPEMKERMETARAKFKEMEERIEKLESEVAELKAGK
jgi:hypothetical protein